MESWSYVYGEIEQAFGDFGFGELSAKQLPSGSIGDVLSNKMGLANAFSGDDDDDESATKLSCSVVDCNIKDSSLIDLKLGRFLEHKGSQNSSFSIAAPIFFSPESSTPPPKRVRDASMNSHTAYCQVYGCHKDLTSSKDYHKRHRVCEAHSKTAKVIVNGIEQRFCQQCSRFHLLAEFDDGKRSCRKRLAGHNERRRKPQVGIRSGRTESLQCNGTCSMELPWQYDGGRFDGNMLTATSFICQDLLPTGLLHHEKNEWGKRIKVEDGTDYRPVSAIPLNGQFHSRSPYPAPSGVNKLFYSFHDNGANAVTGIHPHTNSGSRPLFRDASLGSEDTNVFDSAPTIHGLSEISNSGCALSPVIAVKELTKPLIRNSLGIFPGGEAADFDITDVIYQGSEFMNTKDHISCQDGPTIDLLQLSSQLHQVEHQRRSTQVKPENDALLPPNHLNSDTG
ncbi:Detected protein of unknown function [Hibiscus syriacus]|uniref:SBP-type domain-containing protein n=1 Tax=Hibiscus syriacus TaxID=106335 RepID=A0A6A2XMW5_HIBSY|nr:Detected protein of unknown function [Hibiscus syriacus]